MSPENTVLVAVGDFDPRRLVSLVKAQFGAWPAGGRLSLRFPRSSNPGVPASAASIIPANRSTSCWVTWESLAAIPTSTPLLILDHIFGSGPGFCDRLGRIVPRRAGPGLYDRRRHDRLGRRRARALPGLRRARLPDQADRVIGTITEQIRAMHAGAFSDDEVDRARRYLTGAWVFDYQSVEQRAERLLELERWGLSLDEPLALARSDRRDHAAPGAQSRSTPSPARCALPRRARPAAPSGQGRAGGMRINDGGDLDFLAYSRRSMPVVIL